MSVIAVDLGGTKVATALVSSNGDVRARHQDLLGGRSGGDVTSLVLERCRSLLAEGDTDAIGVVVPGIYRAERGTVWAPNIPGWDDYPLMAELQHALGSAIRVVIDSDRAGCILGETWRGAACGARDAIFLAVGTGIGAGILVDGRVLRGHADIAGAIGWLALDRPYTARYANCGCFEYHASGPGLTNLAREQLGTTDNELTTSQVFEAFDRDDPVARRVIEEAIEFWGMATANLVSLFNPETIVFGGGVFGPAVRFLDRIRTEAERWAQPLSMRQVRLVASALGGDAALYGAARLAMQVDWER